MADVSDIQAPTGDIENSNININLIIRYLAAGVFFVCLLAVCVILLVELRLEQRFADRRQIVTVDAADLVVQSLRYVDPNISEDAMAERMIALNGALEGVVNELAAKHNLMVLNSASVLTGADDFTAMLAQALAEALNE